MNQAATATDQKTWTKEDFNEAVQAQTKEKGKNGSGLRRWPVLRGFAAALMTAAIAAIGALGPFTAAMPQGARKFLMGSLRSTLKDDSESWSVLRRNYSAEEVGDIDQFGVDIAEVFSPPRMVQRAGAMGMSVEVDASFDLLTGYDLSQTIDQERCKKRLMELNPFCVSLSPPCTYFSTWMYYNVSHMNPDKFRDGLEQGVAYLEFCLEIMQWQSDRGGRFIFEHPAFAKSWEEEALLTAARLPNVVFARTDMCRWGLKGPAGKQKIKKPTFLMGNDTVILKSLAKTCTCKELHRQVEGQEQRKGTGKWMAVSQWAQIYTTSFCTAVLTGVRRSRTTLIEGTDVFVIGATGTKEAVAATQKIMTELRRVHNNMGHPSQESFIRCLRAGGAAERVLRLAAKLRCAVCNSLVRQKSQRPSSVPLTERFNVTVGVDHFEIDAIQGDGKVHVQNCVCWGTSFQVAGIVLNTSSEEARSRFSALWVRPFGAPSRVVVDRGTEFRGAFFEYLQRLDIETYTAPTEAPWQNGRTERHGGYLKEIIAKVRVEVPPRNSSDLQEIIDSSCAAKNRLMNRAGYSPAQRVFGVDQRMPGSLLDDGEPSIGALSRSLGGDEEARRAQRIREQAMQACLEVMSQDRLKRARLSRTRPNRPTFEPGQRVYFWRRRGLRQRNASAYWQGPAVVIQQEGRNAVWLAFGNYCIKACPEHLRPLTEEEELGVKHVPEELREVKHNLETMPAHDYWDITKEERPPKDEDDFSDVEDEAEARRAEDSDDVKSEDIGRPPVIPEVPVEPRSREPEQLPEAATGSTALVPVAGGPADQAGRRSLTERETHDEAGPRALMDKKASDGPNGDGDFAGFFRELATTDNKRKEQETRRKQLLEDFPKEAFSDWLFRQSRTQASSRESCSAVGAGGCEVGCTYKQIDGF